MTSTAMMILWLLVFAASAALAARRAAAGGILVASSLPFYLIRTQVAGVPTTVLEAVVLGSLAGFLFSRDRDLDMSAFRRSPFLLPALALLAAATVSLFVTPDLRAAAGVWRAYFLEPVLVLPLLLGALRGGRTRAIILRVLACETILIAGHAVLQAMGALPVVEPWTLERRATSVYPFPNAVGLYLGPLIALIAACAAFGRAETRRDRSLFAVAALAGIAGIVSSRTDGAIGAVALAFIAIGLGMGKKERALVVVASFIALLTLVSGSVTLGPSMSSLTLQDWSGTVRRVMWRETVAMLRDRPVFGAGLSGYPTAVAPYHKDPNVEIFQYPHDAFLNVWSELGILGLAAVAWLLIAFLRTLHLLTRDGTWHLRAAAALAMLVIVVHGLVDVPYFKNDLALLTWTVLLLPWATKKSVA